MLQLVAMPTTNEDKHREAYEAAQAAARSRHPDDVARLCGGAWHADADQGDEPPSGVLEFRALGHPVRVTWPALGFEASNPLLQIFPWRMIALHYLAGVTGRGPSGDWVSYRELPDGLFYADTITREVEQPLARLFGSDAAGFLSAGVATGGEPGTMADASIIFHPLPTVPVAFALWVEDEEFPAQVKVLYDRAGATHVPLQDLRILADLLGGALRRHAQARRGIA